MSVRFLPNSEPKPTGASSYCGTPTREAALVIDALMSEKSPVEVPEGWSQVASDVIAQKYFRKAGVPARLRKVEENDVPSFLWRSVADEVALAELPEEERTGFLAGLGSGWSAFTDAKPSRIGM